MNDQRSLSDEVRGTLDEHAPTRPPNHLLQSFEFNARRKRQYPRWLALIKEPTMRTNSSIAVGSPTARVAAIVAATLLLATALAAAGIAGSQLLAADGRIVVDRAGNGDYTTIGEAVAAAADGDEIVVKPGEYDGSVLIDKDLIVRGDGEDPSAVSVATGDSGPKATAGLLATHYAFWLQGAAAEFANMTITGPGSGAVGFLAGDGELTIHDLAVDFDRFAGYPYASVYLDGDAQAEVRDSVAGPFLVGNEASLGLYDSEVGLVLVSDSGDVEVVDTDSAGMQIEESARVRVEGSTFTEAPACAIDVDGWETDVTISGNVINGSLAGICVLRGSHTEISDNQLAGNETGIQLIRSDALVSGNSVTGGAFGVVVQGPSSPVIEDNAIDGSSVAGVSVESGASPSLSGNAICGSAADFVVQEGTSPTIDDDNEVCADSTTD